MRHSGTPLKNIPKRILAVTTQVITNGTSSKQGEGIALYLVSYKQDYENYFYTPTFVPSTFLESIGLEDMMIDFYKYNALALVKKGQLQEILRNEENILAELEKL